MSIKEQKRIIREHYGLNRAVTDEEVAAEIAMILRHIAKGGIADGGMEQLASRLDLL